MSDGLTIALDAMGGDHAPDMVIKGANIARQRFPQVRFLFFGDEARIDPLIDKLPSLRAVSETLHAEQEVRGEDKPSQALRSGRASSMRLAINAVHDGRAAGVVSAGNTGALMAMAKFVLKTMPGIDRPAIASFFPTIRGESVMLDLGANIQCDANNLVQFAVMGNVFARTVLGVPDPTYGLLNVGSEDLKGNEAVREASAILRATSLPGHFHGFVEGDDIAKGTVDVVVTDGFTGNVALKAIEGTAKLYAEFLRKSFMSSAFSRLGYLLARPAIRSLKVRTDPRRYNGAIFLGLNGIAVKSHGGTDALGFANAIGVAIDMVLHQSIDRIGDDFARLTTQPQPASQAAAL
ncbi:phosphate acyltransferase PlsX [Rhodospirillaceae bacterium SYSU D60014]|uniref:phosphate acyltransferase PlsX n=1 Tax=Virgifigura deserti TaxID=2268457 RepID=UPI000E675C42